MSNLRKSQGHQKIEMKKITNKSSLQVTFTKRRKGLFKKASELSTLCGVEIALIVVSPGGKVFSFGHPNIDAVIDRYQMRGPMKNSKTMNLIESHPNANYVCELNDQLTQINVELEMEKKRSDDLNQARKEAQMQFWLASPIEDMNGAQLDQFKLALDVLKKSVTPLVEKQLILQDAFANPPPHFFAGESSSKNLMLLDQPPSPPPHQMFPVPPSQMMQNPPLMLPPHMFNEAMLMHHQGFNNMGGFGPAGGFF